MRVHLRPIGSFNFHPRWWAAPQWITRPVFSDNLFESIQKLSSSSIGYSEK
jgi:hypothetical protein